MNMTFGFYLWTKRAKKPYYSEFFCSANSGRTYRAPYADVLHGSKKYKNLKELRNQTQNHLLRVSYYFDSARNAFLLTGGDKKGKNQDKFYKDLITESEVIIEKHEKELENERRNQNDGK